MDATVNGGSVSLHWDERGFDAHARRARITVDGVTRHYEEGERFSSFAPAAHPYVCPDRYGWHAITVETRGTGEASYHVRVPVLLYVTDEPRPSLALP